MSHEDELANQWANFRDCPKCQAPQGTRCRSPSCVQLKYAAPELRDGTLDRVEVAARTTPAIFLLNMITREVREKDGDLFSHFNFKRVEGENVTADVELKINGVPVNFSAAITDMWERLSAEFNKKVAKEAKQIVSTTRFGKYESIIAKAEREIISELSELFPDISEDDWNDR